MSDWQACAQDGTAIGPVRAMRRLAVDDGRRGALAFVIHRDGLPNGKPRRPIGAATPVQPSPNVAADDHADRRRPTAWTTCLRCGRRVRTPGSHVRPGAKAVCKPEAR